jgi:hypothetical protein
MPIATSLSGVLRRSIESTTGIPCAMVYGLYALSSEYRAC